MTLSLYDTLTREQRPFEPREEGRASLYVCGPTVQGDAHIGHGRAAVVFDILHRYLAWSGYAVTFVQNVTDIDDKIILRARRERLEPAVVATRYTRAWNRTMDALGVLAPHVQPLATGHLLEMQALIQRLVDQDKAYAVEGNVFFRVRTFDGYGKLSGRRVDDMQQGEDIVDASDKEDPLDFAMWKAAKPGEPAWPSPWGDGRPGWHIECSAMAAKHLGHSFDIHGGGLDLVFPHHECELAQARGAGKPFARYWLHWNMLTLGGEKMSKSRGHVVELASLFELVDPMVLRFHLLRSHYRSLSDFADEAVQASAAGLRRLRSAYASWPATAGAGTPAEAWSQARARFAAAMDADLNTPEAIAVLFDVARDANKARDAGDFGCAAAARALFDELLAGVLGVDVAGPGGDDSELLESVVGLLLEQREEARRRRDFAAADAIRERLAELDLSVEDTPEGPRWRRSV